MPKKSDRSDHGSAMSDLMPEVSLDEKEDGGSQEKKKSTQEEKKSRFAEEKKNSSKRGRAVDGAQGSEPGGSESDGPGAEERPMRLRIHPDRSPDLTEKLGLLVSKEVEEVLDEAYLSMRMEHGKKAKKSLIVEAALRYLLSEYQQSGAASSEISDWMGRVIDKIDD